MTRKTCVKAILLVLICTVQAALSLPAEFNGYELLPGTTSPDGKFGLIYPRIKSDPGYANELSVPNPALVLVALPAGTPVTNVPLGFSTLTLGNSSYYATWNKTSTAVLIVEGIKWGADKVFLVDIAGKPRISDITAEIRKILQPLFARSGAPRFNDTFDFIFDYENRLKCERKQVVFDSGWQFGPDQTVLVNCTCTTDPKKIEPKRWTVNFTGTWDIKTGRFTATHVQDLP